MRIVALSIIVLLTAHPAVAQQRSPISQSVEKAVAAAADAQQPASRREHGKLFWPGIAVGVAGATTTVLGLTTLRTEDRSAGNSVKGLYRSCVAQAAANPVYATNDCSALKGANRSLVWGGAAVGAIGAAMILGSIHTSAELAPGVLRVSHRIRF